MEKMLELVIIGGGASGLYLASQLSGVSATIVETAPRVGKKLLSTGNGKCNLSNEDCSPRHYNNPDAAAEFLRGYGEAETLRDFKAMGLAVKSAEGRVYPYSECASSVLDILRMSVAENGVTTVAEHTVTALKKAGDSFLLTLTASDGGTSTLRASRVVLATGSDATFGRDSLALFTSLGHTRRAFSPSLVPLKTDRESVKGLNGVRVKCAITFAGKREEGEILFRDFGLSGIAAFNASASAARGQAVTGEDIILDFMPAYTLREAQAAFASVPERTTGDTLRGFFHSRLCERIAERAGLSLSDAPDAERLARAAKEYRLEYRGTADKSYAQVMSGGLALAEFDGDLQSRICKGAYAVGEALDIDGDCGGYNLQWAWTSAATVARAINETKR